MGPPDGLCPVEMKFKNCFKNGEILSFLWVLQGSYNRFISNKSIIEMISGGNYQNCRFLVKRVSSLNRRINLSLVFSICRFRP